MHRGAEAEHGERPRAVGRVHRAANQRRHRAETRPHTRPATPGRAGASQEPTHQPTCNGTTLLLFIFPTQIASCSTIDPAVFHKFCLHLPLESVVGSFISKEKVISSLVSK